MNVKTSTQITQGAAYRVVSFEKNGRAVSEAEARRYLEANFPLISTWKLKASEHKLVAMESCRSSSF